MSWVERAFERELARCSRAGHNLGVGRLVIRRPLRQSAVLLPALAERWLRKGDWVALTPEGDVVALLPGVEGRAVHVPLERLSARLADGSIGLQVLVGWGCVEPGQRTSWSQVWSFAGKLLVAAAQPAVAA